MWEIDRISKIMHFYTALFHFFGTISSQVVLLCFQDVVFYYIWYLTLVSDCLIVMVYSWNWSTLSLMQVIVAVLPFIIHLLVVYYRLCMKVIAHCSLFRLLLIKGQQISFISLLSTQFRFGSIFHIESTDISWLVCSPFKFKLLFFGREIVGVFIDGAHGLHFLFCLCLVGLDLYWFFFCFFDPECALLLLNGNVG